MHEYGASTDLGPILAVCTHACQQIGEDAGDTGHMAPHPVGQAIDEAIAVGSSPADPTVGEIKDNQSDSSFNWDSIGWWA